MIFFSLSAFMMIVFLEVINFVEHYGLRRQQLKDGSYEPANVTHSWNTPARLTNYVLFKLQRHSDHHENSFKEYWCWRACPRARICRTATRSASSWLLFRPSGTRSSAYPYAKEYQETTPTTN